jgi:hypothetical protein
MKKEYFIQKIDITPKRLGIEVFSYLVAETKD